MAKPFKVLRDKMSPEARKLAKEKAQSIREMVHEGITTEAFDKKFDEGKEDALQYCNLSKATRPNQK